MRCQKSVPALRERAVKSSGAPQKLAVKNFKVKVEKKLKIQMPLFRRILITSEQILKKITYFLSKYNPFKNSKVTFSLNEFFLDHDIF